METGEDSVVVLLGGKKLRIDLYNLKDPERAKRNEDGLLGAGECYFEFDAAQEAAKVVGKRLMTHEEQECMIELPSRWDTNLKGQWFTFNTPQGTTVEVFFPAEGYRNYSYGSLYSVGRHGEYWSGSGNGMYGYNLAFGNGYVDWSINNRQHGFSVRCVIG